MTNEKTIPSLSEIMNATFHQDAILDLVQVAKIQARTIERLTTPPPSLPSVVAEWMPMLSVFLEMLGSRFPAHEQPRDVRPPMRIVDAAPRASDSVDHTA